MNIRIYEEGGSGHFSCKSALSNSISGGTITIFPRSVVGETISSFQSLGGSFFLDGKKKEKKRNIDPGGDLCSFVKNTGTQGRENTTRFFMAYLILRSIFGVKIFSLVAVRVDFSCSFFFFFSFLFYVIFHGKLRIISAEESSYNTTLLRQDP